LSTDILHGDCREVLATLPAESVQTCVTSPPYWGLRDYGVPGQLGLERTPAEYVANMVAVFREVRRVLRDDGTLWLNLGDSYAAGGTGGAPSAKSTLSRHGIDGRSPYLDAMGQNKSRTAPLGLKPKDLVGIPWRVAFALQADGWYLRSDIIWHKPNPMPESVTDRPTKAHEYLFLLAKSERYYYDADAIAEPFSDKTQWTYPQPDKAAAAGQTTNGTGASGLRAKPDRENRNRRSVWSIATQPFDGAHFATFPRTLIEPCILAGSRPGDVVLDPFMGSGTTAQVSEHLGRQWIGCELNPEYVTLQAKRLQQRAMAF
jgi:DNA modification methylase